MSILTLKETFATADGVEVIPTSVLLSDPTGTFGVKRNDTDAVVIADATAMVYVSADSNWQYSFTQPADGLTYTYWVEWIYNSETFRDEHTVIGSVPDGITSVRNTDKYLTWLQTEFKPLTLATPVATQKQLLENAIRYWNTHSGYKIMQMVDYTPGTARVRLSTEFKSVVTVYPTASLDQVWSDHPTWTLLGLNILDNITTDLIITSQAFRDYRMFTGTDFTFTFDKSEDPTIGGYLYAENVPSGTVTMAVVGTKRVTNTEDIKQEYILDWILQYTKALLSIVEGHTLRTASIVDIKTPGDSLRQEGLASKEKLQQKLTEDSRWVVMAKRA